MSRKGDCRDDAVAESFFHSMKTEWTTGTPYHSRDDARSDVIHYIKMFYNSNRLHSYLNYKNPNDFEKNFVWAKAA
jgi:transposase InsO family protein